MMQRPVALVLCGDGINCDAETAFALQQAGFSAVRVHSSTLLEAPKVLFNVQLFVLPGGFSFGDEIASGKVMAIKLKARITDYILDYSERGGLVLGICNGFQVLVQMGVLPVSKPQANKVVSLAHNRCGRFINKWVDLEVVGNQQQSPFLKGLRKLQLPIRHGEGRLCVEEDAEAQVRKHAVLRYTRDINGSFENVAALSNEKGNMLGLMPHPEAFVRWDQHPAWMSWQGEPSEARTTFCGGEHLNSSLPDGLAIMLNAFSALN